MIALDSSALIALVQNEPEAQRIAERMAAAAKWLIGYPTELELHMVTAGKSNEAAARQVLHRLIGDAERISFDRVHLTAAQLAFDRFGKGRHPAALNYGDCMAYAVARVANCPLLYKGEDFARTDIRPAL